MVEGRIQVKKEMFTTKNLPYTCVGFMSTRKPFSVTALAANCTAFLFSSSVTSLPFLAWCTVSTGWPRD